MKRTKQEQEAANQAMGQAMEEQEALTIDEKKAAILRAYLLVADKEAAEAAEKLSQEAAEAEARDRAERGILLNLVRVLSIVKGTEEYKQAEYAGTLQVLSEKLEDAASISEFLIATDKHWPKTETGTKNLGIGKAAKNHYPPAMGLAAYNVWRTNYTRGFLVLPKQLVTIFKAAERLINNLQYEESTAALKHAVNQADSLIKSGDLDDLQQAADILTDAIEKAETRHAVKVEAEEREKAEQEAAEAIQIAATLKNLELAPLSRVLESIKQLAENPLLNEQESGLIIAAGHKVAVRVQEAARKEQEAAQREQEAARKEQEAAEEQSKEAEKHHEENHQEEITYEVK